MNCLLIRFVVPHCFNHSGHFLDHIEICTCERPLEHDAVCGFYRLGPCSLRFEIPVLRFLQTNVLRELHNINAAYHDVSVKNLTVFADT